MRMQKSILVILIVLFTVGRVDAQSPSAPEENAKVVELARLHENDPLGKDSKKARQWFRDWIAERTVRLIPACDAFLESEGKNKHSEQLTFQFKISTAAFMIEHADQAEDSAARLLAGITGMLRAYTKILEMNPKSKSEFLDSLLSLQNKNPVASRVREIMAQCSDEPLSDKNPRLPTGELIYAPIEVERLPFIARMPYPPYVATARHNLTQGTVVLHVVLGANGKVTHVEVIKGLRNGLTESSVKTAETIRFEPSLVGGKPVSTLLKVDYEFTIQ